MRRSSHAPAQASQIEAVDWRLDLEVALRMLTVNERSAITLCYTSGLTQEEAAQVLQCPLGTVKTNILAAKEKLRRHLLAWKDRRLT